VSCSVKIKASAAKSLRALPRSERERLAAAIDRLSDEPHAGGALKGEFSGLRRLRVGRYRNVYEVLAREPIRNRRAPAPPRPDRIAHEVPDGELTVLVVRIGHRREVYR
jgi:mRNA interferase RelE/StbE